MDKDTPLDTPTSVATPRRQQHEAPKKPWIRRVRIARRPSQAVEILDGEASRQVTARNAIFRRLLLVGDLLAAAVSLLIVSLIFGATLQPVSLLLIPTIAVIGKLSGVYDRDEYRLAKTTLDEAPSLFRLSTLLTLLVYLSGNVLVEGGFGRWDALSFWALLFVSLVGFRWIARQVAAAATDEERCIIIGDAESADWLAQKLERSHRTHVDLIGRVGLHAADADTGDIEKLGDFEQLPELLAAFAVDRALVAPGRDDPEEEVLTAIRLLKRNGVYVSILPSPLEVVGTAIEFDEVEGATLLGVRRHGLSRSSRFVKRAFDLTLSLFGLLILSPLMAVIAIAIKIDSRGPVFFRQPRMGKDDKPFDIYKFRTMADGADAQREALADRNEAGGGLFKIDDDPRITKIGKFLRRTSLDELPQLINVVRGEMSMVGPRPLVLDEDERITGLDRSRLLVVPPGVTGMWQILGSARIPMDEMVKIDYLYGAHWSLWLDIKILIRTVPFALSKRGL